jgi:hypothetical protein
MSGDVIATDTQIATARSTILRQLQGTGVADGFDSLAHALDELGMWDFVENQARVVAQLHAFSVRDTAIIQKLTNAGAYAKLDFGDNE